MAKRYVPKTYKNHRAARTLLKLVLALMLAGIVLFVSLFFGLRKYIVYAEDGTPRLVIPFLEESANQTP